MSPNRFNGLYGAAHAAALAGDSKIALRYFQELLVTASLADADNARLEEAKAFMRAPP